MKTNYFFSIAIAAVLLINCKGKDGAPGPAGKDGAPVISGSQVTDDGIITKEGFIKFTLNTTVEGKPATYNFDFQGSFISDKSSYTVLGNDVTEIGLLKAYMGDGDSYIDGYLFMSFYVEDLVTMSNPELNRFGLDATKQLSSNKILNIELDNDESNIEKPTTPLTFTDLKYDPVTSIITGKFSGDIYNKIYSPAGSSKNVLNKISNGSFSTVLVTRMSNERKSN